MNLNKFVEEAIETVRTSVTAATCYANVCYAQGRLASYLELNAITIEEFIEASNKVTKAYADYLDKKYFK